MKGNLFNPMKSLLAVLLTVIIIFGSIVSVSAQGSLLNDMPQQNSDIIKVVSYNIWTQLMPGTENALELRAERLKQVISQYKPDSIGFQEARYEWMEWLGQNLTDYSYVGVGRENGRIDPECGEASPIFYLKDKFNLLDSGTFWLSETPEIPSIGWDAAYKRICTWAVLENKQTKECYAHINTHLDNVGETARIEGVKLILDKIDELGATYPIVCTGDFNANMYSEPYKLMVEHENEDSGVRMADSLFCAEEVINQGGTMPDINASPMDSELKADGELAIDHCFISANSFDAKLYKVMRDTVDNKYISDHYGVYVELAFGEETGERPMPESPYVENTYNASYGTANIDGIMDASYAAAEVIEVNKRSSGSLASSALATAKVRTIYDNNYIYIFAEVTDNTPNDSTTSSKQGGYGIDGFQIYFDFVNNDSADATEDDYNYESNNGVENHESGHFICYPDGITQPYAEQGAAGYLGDESKLQYRTMKTETGYNVEVRLALSNSLKQRLANDEQNIEIGIGYQINDDSNDDGMRNFDIYCSPRIRDAWKSPLYLDKLVLVSTTPVGQPYIATKGTANIDGVMDDVYKDAQPIWVNRDGSDGIVSDQATATVRTIYDDEFIYCFAKVIDSTPNNENTRPVNNYGVDGVQFFFDFIGNENYTEHESGYIITDLVATDDRKANGGTIGRANQGFSSYVKGKEYDYRAVATEDGYNIEFKLALSESLKNRIASNEQNIKIGIGFQINDDTNDDGNRDKLCYSKGAIKDAWKSNGPSMLESIYLTGESEVSYHIIVDQMSGGIVSVDKKTAKSGESVRLVVTPNEGYQLKEESLKVNGVIIEGDSFIMPEANVIITAEFEEISMVVDKTQLEALVNESMGKREEDYTPESWSVFQTALDNAQRVLEKQDVTQDEVDDAKNLLQAALDGLKLKDGEPAPVAVLKGSDEVRVGEDFTLTFGLEQAKGITAQEIIITYNTENFELVDVKSVAEGITIVGEDTTDPGSIKIILASEGEDNAVNGDKDIMEIKFKIKKDFGTDIITASKILLADGEGKEVAVAAVSKTVNVVTAITGDVNGDGVVSIADLGIAAKYYGYSSGDSSWEAAKKADIDYNNKIEMADLVFIAKKILGLE